MEIAEILALKTWAVVGLTDHPHRPAHGVARFLLDHGREVIPVNPAGEAVHGRQGFEKLADIPVPVDVVDIFRRSTEAGRTWTRRSRSARRWCGCNSA
ncbi:CoA-binding protein [Longispora urticae]